MAAKQFTMSFNRVCVTVGFGGILLVSRLKAVVYGGRRRIDDSGRSIGFRVAESPSAHQPFRVGEQRREAILILP